MQETPALTNADGSIAVEPLVPPPVHEEPVQEQSVNGELNAIQATPVIINGDGTIVVEGEGRSHIDGNDKMATDAKPATADGAKPATTDGGDSAEKVKSIGSPDMVKKDPKKMKELQDIIKKIMKPKKGKRPAGAKGDGGDGPGDKDAKGMGNIDAGPEPPLTKVFESTKLSVTCDKGKCQVKQCKSGKCS